MTYQLSPRDRLPKSTFQVRPRTGWFTYGSSVADELDGEAELIAAIEKEERQSGQKLYRRDGNRAATWTRIKVSFLVANSKFEHDTKLNSLQAFAIDKYAVSNTQFQKFVRETKHKTDAEEFQWSFVLEYLAPKAVVEEVKCNRFVAEITMPSNRK